MPVIKIVTLINAPATVVFDLSRSVDLHTLSTVQTKERAIAGRTSGLMEYGETVTWEARHFGFTQKPSSSITHYDRPQRFTDEMVKGIFKRFSHTHLFEFDTQTGTTTMTDVFDYESPLGILGYIADVLFLKNYMTDFLKQRNKILKAFAEDPVKYSKVIS